MDPIDEVERQYQRIMPDPASPWHHFPTREIQVWLEGMVVRLIEPYLSRPDFQSLTTWSIRSLAANSGTPERQVVEAADRALVAAASALRDAARLSVIQSHLPRPEAISKMSPVTLSDSESSTVSSRSRRPHWPVWIRSVDHIASRPWIDFVNPSDFFAPQPNRLLQNPDPLGPGDGGMIQFFNPKLPLLGDLVSRYALGRFELWMESLEDSRRTYLDAVRLSGAHESAEIQAETAAWATLNHRAKEFGTMCLASPQAAMREDFMVLTQTYNAFHPQPSLDWMGLATECLRYGTGTLRNAVSHRHLSAVTDRIATAVRSLRLLDETTPANRSEVDRAIEAGGLVLVKQPRAAYWATQRLDVDWDRHAKDWELLLRLVEKARAGMRVEDLDLYAEAPATSTMATRKHRLSLHLPRDLREKILSRGSRAYLLDLPAKQLRIFEIE